jgi:hypothetical protein
LRHKRTTKGGKNLLTLKKYLKKFIHKDIRPSLSRECMAALSKAGAVSGPYAKGASIQMRARWFLMDYADGDYRARVWMPDMTVADLNVLAHVARW